MTSIDEISETFSLDESCEKATCDICGEEFFVKFFGDIQEHHKSHKVKRLVDLS